ncbi:GNAT family N-acetyltransferase [Flammeovirga sp. MY04]|uniref:GNAT family N-acetyltransferase n=1 Tax=Flammeovirga sp. MY04 TaxID=1191459 RepID=UPI0008063AF1|nr:GNAT family N-acetyltransferase [Flammeovirga sp. MY04]ANQ51734.1 GNAT family N-acetyltransferase [Flammeovirga sp. MY04]
MNPNLKYIKPSSDLYTQAKRIRIECFFEGMQNAEALINDPFEKEGIHLVLLDNLGKVIGTGRIHTEGSIGIISQMAVQKEHQKVGVGRILLTELIDKCKSLGMDCIELSARETALQFYIKNGFQPIGNRYPSKKTGIIHQKMRLDNL